MPGRSEMPPGVKNDPYGDAGCSMNKSNIRINIPKP
jgi:hypothetical protein